MDRTVVDCAVLISANREELSARINQVCMHTLSYANVIVQVCNFYVTLRYMSSNTLNTASSVRSFYFERTACLCASLHCPPQLKMFYHFKTGTIRIFIISSMICLLSSHQCEILDCLGKFVVTIEYYREKQQKNNGDLFNI